MPLPAATRTGRLAGRTALIVGGTGGIGLATARRFLQEGARVVIAGRDRAPDASLAELDMLGPIREHPVEVGAESSVEALFEQALDDLSGRLDLLVHVAGLSGRRYGDGPLHECTLGGWDTVLQVNARGVFLTNRAGVRQMLTQPPDDRGQRGSILNLGSVLDQSPAPSHFGTLAYAASKGAVRSLTLAAAARYAPERIRFNLVNPGLIDTPMAARAVGDPTIQRYLASRQPLAGGPGSAADVAEAILGLSEPAAQFLTGVVLNVDGGWCLSERGPEPPAEPNA